MGQEKKELTVVQVCRMTGSSRSSLYHLHKKGWVIPEQRKNPLSNMEDRFYSEDQAFKVKFLRLIENKEGADFCYRLYRETLEKSRKYQEEEDRLLKKNSK